MAHTKKAHMKEHEKKEKMSCKGMKEAKGMKKEEHKKEHHAKKK
jgi:hypothetical protein